MVGFLCAALKDSSVPFPERRYVVLLCIASFCFKAASVTILSRVIRTPWQEDSFVVRWYYYYFAGFFMLVFI